MNTKFHKLALAGTLAGLLGVPSLSSAQDVTPRAQNVTPPSYDVTPPRVNVSPIPAPNFRRRTTPSIAPGLIVPRPGHRPRYVPVPNYYYYWPYPEEYYWSYPAYPSVPEYRFGW